jgi:hypothetical protein
MPPVSPAYEDAAMPGYRDNAIANSDDRQEDGGVPDLAPLRVRFAPVAARLPIVAVNLPSIASYDVLVPAMAATACATTGAVA